MADKFLTLLDLTKRSGSDAAVGLVEEVNTFAPEIDVIAGRPIKGTSFKYSKRTSLPAGPAFRRVNEGSDLLASTYVQALGECFFLDGQMQVDEALVQGDDRDFGDILADEAVGVTKQKMIALGDSFYRGTTADAKGFAGLQSFVDSGMVIDATGTGGSTTSAWLVWNAPQGVHFVFGNGIGLQLGEWVKQQVTRTVDGSTKALMAHVNNLSGWIGLAMVHSKSVARVKNITSAKPLTDALVAEALSKFPVGQRPNRLLINRTAAFLLQRSRSAVSINNRSQGQSNGSDVFAPVPTESNGVPITITDSISASETAS